MSMEKRGVISDEDTPVLRPCTCPNERCPSKGEPTTKEAADRMESHLANDLTDAVAAQSRKNR